MQIIRYLLFTLAVLAACSTVGADLPTRIGTSAFALALYDSDGLYGGQELFILTNGMAYARAQRPPQKKESGLQERRYRLQLTANEVQTLRALLDRHQFLTLTVPGGTGIPHEQRATIALRLPDGQRRDVFKWQRHPQAGFTAIHRHLLGILHRAEKTQPVFQGESVYAWSPEGFVR